MKKIKKCISCKINIHGEEWRKYCIDCYKALKTEQTRMRRLSQGARLTAPIDARKSDVRKAKLKMKVVLPDPNWREKEWELEWRDGFPENRK